MLRLLHRFPPALWLAVYVASLFILMGGRGRLDLLAVGGALCITACGVAVWLALRPWPGHPRPSIFQWTIAAVVAFYAICALVAGLALGLAEALAALAAGVVPLTAVALLLATVRAKTAETDDGL